MEILRRVKGINIYYEVKTDERNNPVLYFENMLRSNHLSTILPVQFQRMDGELSLLFKADGMVSLPRKWGAAGPGWKEVQELLKAVADCITEIQEFLLPADGILLSLPYLFYDENLKRIRFMIVPEPGPDFATGMKQLMEEILPVFDHSVEADVIKLYDLYGRFLDGSFTPAMLLQMMENSGSGQGRITGNYREPTQWNSGKNSLKGSPSSEKSGTGCVTEVDFYDVIPPEPFVIERSGREGKRRKAKECRNDEEDRRVKECRNDEKEERNTRPFVLYGAGGITLAGAAVLYILLGNRSLGFIAILGGAFVIFLICNMILEERGEREEREEYERNLQQKEYREREDGERNLQQEDYRERKDGERNLQREAYQKQREWEPYGKKAEENPSGHRLSWEVAGTSGTYSVPVNHRGAADRVVQYPDRDDDDYPTDLLQRDNAPVRAVEEGIHKLVPSEKGKQLPILISEGYCRIGRSERENEYCIPDPSISRTHARIECVGRVVTLRDLGSTNGTFINHVRLLNNETAELHFGDVVSFAGEEYYCS